MTPLGNDRWTGRFLVAAPGPVRIHDRGLGRRASAPGGATWRKKVEAGQDVASELLEGAEHVRERRRAGQRATTPTGSAAGRAARRDGDQADADPRGARPRAARPRWPATPTAAAASTLRAASSASWSSASAPATAPGTRCSRGRPRPSPAGTARSRTSRRGCPTSPAMGFDVLYLPADPPDRPGLPQGAEQHADARPRRPGQPLGHRRGPRGATRRSTPSSGRSTTSTAWSPPRGKLGIEIALDIAFQCSPDHPYVREHPEWFRHRPDGTIKYAENPPKKYQDIYPIDFECDDWQALWAELRDVFLFWVDHGVKIFRVDNPHTKPFRFWEWVIREVRDRHPDAIFLAEAFTRPKVMKHLAKGGYLAVVQLLHLAERPSRA